MIPTNAIPASTFAVPSTTTSSNNLWAAAVAQLSDDDQKEIQVQQKDRLTIVNDALFEAQKKAAQCVEKEWKRTRADGTTVAYRDMFNKIVSWIDNFKQVGDLAASFEPTYAAPAWAAVKILLQMAIGDSQIYTAMLGNLETLTNLIAQYAIFEQMYLKHVSHARQLLEQSIIKLYALILAYLVKTKKYFEQNTAKRIVKGSIKPSGYVSDDLKKIRNEQAITEDLARLIDAEDIRSQPNNASELRTLLTDLQLPLDDIKNDLKTISQHYDSAYLSSLDYCRLTRHRRGAKSQSLGLDIDNAIFRPPRSHPKAPTSRFRLVVSESSILSRMETIEQIVSTLVTWNSSLAIDSLRENKLNNRGAGSVAYVYCLRSPAESARAEPDAVVRTLVRQLAYSPSVGDIEPIVKLKYESLTEDGFEPRNLNLDDCQQLLLEILLQRSVIIVMDALDECNPQTRYQLLDLLERLMNLAVHPVKVIVSSRNYGDVAIRMTEQSVLAIDTQEGLSDIDLYIQSEVDRSIRAKAILNGHVSEKLRSLILERLREGAQGMFLWVSLIIRNLCNPERIKIEADAEEELLRVPQGLTDLYAQICERIRAAGVRARQLAQLTLRWLVCSQSTLHSNDFIAFVSLNAPSSDDITTVSSVLDVCSNLVVHDTDLDIFRLTHLSVREFLETQSDFASNIAHATAAEVCLSVFTSPKWLSPTMTWSSSTMCRYAVLYGLTHLGQCKKQQRTGELASRIAHLFATNGTLTPSSTKWMIQISKAVSSLSWDDPLRRTMKQITQDASSKPTTWIFLACAFGLDELVQQVCQSASMRTKCLNSQGATTLHLASQHGHLTIVKLLLSVGIDVNAKNEDSESALTLASANGHVQIVQYLLQHNAEQETDSQRYGSPLQAASFHGHKDIVSLLSARASLEARQGRYGTALQAACFRGHYDIVRILLDLGADVNAPNETMDIDIEFVDRSPARESSRLEAFSKDLTRIGVPQNNQHSRRTRDEVMVDKLQNRPLDYDMRKNGLGSALQVACRGGHASIVMLLLERHADVHYEGGVYGHALQAAAVNGSEAIMTQLFAAGANVDAQSGLYGCALQAACRRNYLHLVRLLLDKGAEVNLHGGHYHTPIQAAARTGNLELIRTLLAHKASANVVGGRYYTALQAAAAYGFTEIVQQLIDHKADVNICGGQYHSALEAAARFGSVETVDLLLTNGSRLYNAVQVAVLEGRLDVVKYFLSQGVSVNIMNRVFGTPLLCAISVRRHDIIKLLHEHEADINLGSRFCGYPLQLAAATGDLLLIEQLLNSDADPTQVGSSRAVHLAKEELNTLIKAVPPVDPGSKGGADFESSSEASLDKSILVNQGTSDPVTTVGYHHDDGLTALETATKVGHEESVKVILENVLTTIRMNHPWKAVEQDIRKIGLSIIDESLNQAIRHNYPKIIRILLHAYQNERGLPKTSVLLWACKHGDRELVSNLLSEMKGSTNNSHKLKDGSILDHGEDPVAVAIHNGHDDLVHLLLGSDVDKIVLGWPCDALGAACTTGNEALVRFLVENGSDIDRTGHRTDRPLMLASALGNVNIVKMLLEAGANPNFWSRARERYDDPWKLTALHAACHNGHAEVAALLLSYKAAVDVQTRSCPTALFLASSQGHYDIVKILCQQGADANAISSERYDSESALYAAVAGGHHKVIKFLLNQGVDCNVRGGKFGTPLKAAAYGGHTESLLALIDAGADVGFTEDIDESRQVHYGVTMRDGFPVFNMTWINPSAWVGGMSDRAHRDSSSSSASTYQSAEEQLPGDPNPSAVEPSEDCTYKFDLDREQRGHVDKRKQKRYSSALIEMLLYKNQFGHSITLRQDLSAAATKLVPDTADGSSQDAFRSSSPFLAASIMDEPIFASGRFASALHAAAHSGSVDCVRILIDRGADILHQDKDGKTALHVAASCDHTEVVSYDHTEVVRELLNHPVSINVQDRLGQTALMLAAGSKREELVSELLRHRPAINVQSMKGMTALKMAMMNGFIPVVELLIGHGVDLDHADLWGKTALHMAVENGHLSVARILIQHGANVNAEDVYDRTPFYYAVEADNVSIMQYLERLEVIKDLPQDGLTWLHRAAYYNSYRIVQILLKRGSDVNARSTVVNSGKRDSTPLHLAITDTSTPALLNTVSILLCHGADPNAKDQDGNTPVSLAIRSGVCAVLDALIRAGGHIETTTCRTPAVHEALSSRSYKMIRLVLDHGADINALDPLGRTALQIIIQSQGFAQKPWSGAYILALLLHYNAWAPNGNHESQFREERESLQEAGFHDRFFVHTGFDLDEPLYDLLDTPDECRFSENYLGPREDSDSVGRRSEIYIAEGSERSAFT